jgi:hypothetical protein
VTAVQTGIYVVNWRIAAGLNGKAKAVNASGGAAQGSFTINITPRPQRAYVNNRGQVVTTR